MSERTRVVCELVESHIECKREGEGVRIRKPISIDLENVTISACVSLVEARGGALRLLYGSEIPLEIPLGGKSERVKAEAFRLIAAVNMVERIFDVEAITRSKVFVLSERGVMLVDVDEYETIKVLPSGPYTDISYCCGSLAIASVDGKLMFYNIENRKVLEYRIEPNFTRYVRAHRGGVIAGSTSVISIDLKGNVRWTFESGYLTGSPAVSGNVVYVPTLSGIVYALDLADGEILHTIEVNEQSLSVDACDDLLAVSFPGGLKLYNFSNNKASVLSEYNFNEMEEKTTVTFSENCKYVARGSLEGWNVKIANVNGDLVKELKFDSGVTSISWRKEIMVVGLSHYGVQIIEVPWPLSS